MRPFIIFVQWHTLSDQKIINGDGFRIADTQFSIDIVHRVRAEMMNNNQTKSRRPRDES